MTTWKVTTLLVVLCAVQVSGSAQDYLRATHPAPTPTAAAHITLTSPFTFATDCSTPAWQYVTGPTAPYPFPTRTELTVTQSLLTASPLGHFHPRDQYILTTCQENSDFVLLPPLHSRKTPTPSPDIFLFSLSDSSPFPSDSIPPTLHTLFLPNHHLTPSLFDHSTAYSAFFPLPNPGLWSLLKPFYTTLAVIPQCEVDFDGKIEVDWIGYELFCAIERMDFTGNLKEKLRKKAVLDYLKHEFNQTNPIFSYFSLSNDLNSPDFWSFFFSYLQKTEKSTLIIVESPTFSVILSTFSLDFPVNLKDFSTSSDLERVILTKSGIRSNENWPILSNNCENSGINWWDCEKERKVPIEIMETLKNQVENELKSEENEEICSEKKVNEDSLVVKTDSREHLSLHFRVKSSAFVGLFRSSGRLLSPWELERVLPTDSPVSMCPKQTLRPKSKFCVC